MYGLTRATLTLIGVAAVGVLLWLATQIIGNDPSVVLSRANTGPRSAWSRPQGS